MPTVIGRNPNMLNAGAYSLIDFAFEPIQFPKIYADAGYIDSSILDVNFNPLKPNISVSINQSSHISINNSAFGNTGQIQISLVTGTEKVTFNGIETFTNPGIVGSFSVTFINTNGILTFS